MDRGIAAPAGAVRWSPEQVRRLLARLDRMDAERQATADRH